MIAKKNFILKQLQKLLFIASVSMACMGITACSEGEAQVDYDSPYCTICEEYKDVRPKYVFSYAENQAKDYPTSLGAFRFAYLVHQKSRGRIQIRVYVDGELGDEQELAKKMQQGGLDFMRASMAGLTSYSPESQVLIMPYLYKDSDHMWRVLDGEIGQNIMDSFNGSGMVALSWYDAGVRNFYSDKPIYCLEDMNGRVVRTQASDIMEDVISCLGASTYPTEYDEVYSALQTGRVDTAENNFASFESMEHYKVAKYYILDGHMRIPELQLISQTTYDKLTDEEKEIIESSAKESAIYERQLWLEREEISRQKIIDEGCVIIELSDEERARFQAAVQPVYKKYCGPYMDLIEEIQSY